MNDLYKIVKKLYEKDKQNIAIAIVGDVCIDTYTFIDSDFTEKSLETGLDVLSVKQIKYTLGGASNVAYNCKQLGVGSVDVYGAIGDDYNGIILKDLYGKRGLPTHHLVTQKDNWSTHMYHKIISDDTEIERFDSGNYNVLSDNTLRTLIDDLEMNIKKYHYVIINEQIVSGIHTPQFIDRLNKVIKNNPQVEWIVDSRNHMGEYNGAIYKCNNLEAIEYYNKTYEKKMYDVDAIGAALSGRFKKPIIITCGSNGAKLFYQNETLQVHGIEFLQKVDVVGAGDAFLAGFATSISAGCGLNESLAVANLNAATSILTLHETGHPTIKELLDMSSHVAFKYNPDIIESPPSYLHGTKVEIIEGTLQKRKPLPKIAIFDHDGTISVLRQGWEEVMESTLLGEYMGVTSSGYKQKDEILHHIRELIQKTTGIQTITQMKYFVQMLQGDPTVDQSNIKSAYEYKRIYLDNLKKAMEYKLTLLEKAELCPEDLTMKGAISFLNTLHKNGTKLYLASGTDEEDVKHEAELLGYAHVFEGRIYGSLDNMAQDPKKQVIQHIMQEIQKEHYSSAQCVVFGDGPVEMREARENNFMGIGLVSDEKQRFGINQEKRERLIRAGAHMLIPDFSQITYIYNLGGNDE